MRFFFNMVTQGEEKPFLGGISNEIPTRSLPIAYLARNRYRLKIPVKCDVSVVIVIKITYKHSKNNNEKLV